ncbi:MAG: LbtU family siderophore porin [Gammaproteobacteria bacterium]|nr:MAG: LbtU family siderophore porin [Gammaproteobacteria bacterium]
MLASYLFDKNLLAMVNIHELILETRPDSTYQGDFTIMKLRIVVASLVALAIVGTSSSAFATTTKKHHKKHHQMTETATQKDVAPTDYKDYKDAVPVCTITQTSMIMDETTQNIGRSLPNPCNPRWYDRIQVSGGLNIDVGKFGNRNANLQGENYQRLSLNDAYVNISALVNDWAKAFASISYSDPTINNNPGVFKNFGAAEYSAAYSNNINGTQTNNVELEQAYATLGNLDTSPFYLQIGKQFQDYGRYEIHPITESLTQVMTQTLATSLKLGFIANGFHGSIFGFDDPINKNSSSTKPTNYGASLGYDQINDQLGYDLGASYLYNMIAANDVAYNVVNFNTLGGTLSDTGSYHSRVGAYALYADVNSGPFTIGGRYTQALQRFNPNDMPKNGVADLTGDIITGALLADASGAKPWAAGLQAGYGFDAWGKDQHLYVGYQTSREAAGMDLPKNRYLVGYAISVFGKNTSLGIEWDHDNAYSTDNGGSGNNTNLVSLRSSVAFG